jgi:Flp pilus assembly protein TadG
MRVVRRLRSCQAGSTAIEFAIVSLVLVLVTLGVIEFGRGLNIRNQLSQAADFGARKILIDKLISDSALEAAVRSAHAKVAAAKAKAEQARAVFAANRPGWVDEMKPGDFEYVKIET